MYAQGINPVTPAPNDLIQIIKPAFANPSNNYTTPPLLSSTNSAGLVYSSAFPLRGNAQYFSAATVTAISGNPRVIITGGPVFSSADIGKNITLGGLGSSGGNPLVTNIIGVFGTTVTLANNSGFTTNPNGENHYVVWGNDDAATLQAAVNAIPSIGGTLLVSPGNYLISSQVLLPSNTEIYCLPGAQFTMLNGWSALANHSIFANQHFLATTLTDTNISIHGCAFEGGTPTPSTGAEIILMRFVSYPNVYDNIFNDFGNATSYLGTFKSVVRNNKAFNGNACWENWFAPTSGTIADNYCLTNRIGIEITGSDTAQTSAGIASDFQIYNNTIITTSSSTSGGACITFDGGALTDTGAGVQHVRVVGNYCGTSGLTGNNAAIGFKATGSGTKDIHVIGMQFNNAVAIVNSVDTGGTSIPTDVHFDGIEVSGLNLAANAGCAIQVHAPSSGASNSRVAGGGYDCGVELTFGTNQYAINNVVDVGMTSRVTVSAGSAPTAVVIDPDELTGTINMSLPATTIYGFSGATDTGLCRSAASTVVVTGSTTACARGGTLGASTLVINAIQVGGGAPTGTTGSCSVGTFTGGRTAGTFVAPLCAAGTIILSGLPTANAWICGAWDQTTIADIVTQISSTATSATFRATTAASDVVQFMCMAN